MADEIPLLPSYRELDDRTWTQLRECTFLAMTALAHLSTREDCDMAVTTLITMNRVLSPDWDGELIARPPTACPRCVEADSGLICEADLGGQCGRVAEIGPGRSSTSAPPAAERGAR